MQKNMNNKKSTMCPNKPQQSSSSLLKPTTRTTSTLNPYAPEWRPGTTTTTSQQPRKKSTVATVPPYQVPPRVSHCSYRGFISYGRSSTLPKPIRNGNRNVKVETRKPIASDGANNNTTVMIRNIPNALRSGFMLKFMDKCCKIYSLEYDFLYLPMDFGRKSNLGYAFVNFTSVGAALKFKNRLQNLKWQSVETDNGLLDTKKVCDITWARIQGRERLIQRYQKSIYYCAQIDFLPMLLDPPRNGLDANPPPPIPVGTMLPPRWEELTDHSFQNY